MAFDPGAVNVVQTFANLPASGQPYSYIQTLGLTTVNDGGGALYYWNGSGWTVATWVNRFNPYSVLYYMNNAQFADFLAGTAAVDQGSAFRAGLAYTTSLPGIVPNSPGPVLEAPPGSYRVASTIFTPSNTNIDMTGATFVGPITNYAQINAGNNPAVPAGSNAADQIGGGCFQTPQPGNAIPEAQWVKFTGGYFTGFRHAFVNTQELNGFEWDSPNWGDSNIGIFAYQSLAYCRVSNPQTVTCNVGIYGGATCCTSDNPYLAAAGSFYNFLGGMSLVAETADPEFHVNATLDAWMEAAILRPSTTTHASDGSGTYNLAAQTAMLSCSGCMIYDPGRSNGIGGNGFWDIRNVHTTFSPRGTIIVGNAGNMNFDNISSEGNFEDATVNAGPPFYYSQITAIGCTNSRFSSIAGGGGLNSGVGPLATINATASSDFIGANITGSIVNPAAFISMGGSDNQAVGPTETPGTGLENWQNPLSVGAGNPPLYFVGGTTILTAYVNGYQLARQDLGSTAIQFESTMNFSLPSSDGTETEALISYFLQPECAAIRGTMELRISRRDTGATDTALYAIRFGDSNISLDAFTGTCTNGTNTIVLNKSGLGKFGNGTPVEITDMSNTDHVLVESISSDGLTLTLYNNITHDHTAATIAAPFIIDYTPIALGSGTAWISTPADNAGRMEITSALTVAVTVDIDITFRYFGPLLAT